LEYIVSEKLFERIYDSLAKHGILLGGTHVKTELPQTRDIMLEMVLRFASMLFFFGMFLLVYVADLSGLLEFYGGLSAFLGKYGSWCAHSCTLNLRS
jgi:hypothetical protein